MSESPSLRVVPVAGKADLGRFITLPSSLMRSDPAWVPPLLVERRMHFSAKTNPFFKHARWQAWIAWRGDRPVGRISAQIDDLHLQRYADATGFFGLLDAEDNPNTFAALIDTAEQWLRDEGMQRVQGPFNLSINDEVGLLVDGFDTSPVFMMGHALPYYGSRIEQCGYRRAKDMLAYIVEAEFKRPRIMQRLLKDMQHRIRVRPLDLSRLDEELVILREVFNDAWMDNWGFVPFTEAEFKNLGHSLKFLVTPELIQIAEVDGEAAAFVVAVPDLNEIIKNFNGKLLPFNWLKLLWQVKVRFTKTIRSPLMGVRRRFHNSVLGPGLAFLVIDKAARHAVSRGAQQIEMSWILEDNAGMRHIAEAMGGHVYKRYRVYEKQLP